MGLPLRETQKVDPTDVDGFWRKHAPPSDRAPGFFTTEEGHSLLKEWDNGTVCHIGKELAHAG